MKKVLVVLVATGVRFCSSNMSVFGSVSVCCQFVLVAAGLWFCTCRCLVLCLPVFGSVSVCCQFVLVATGVWFCSCRQACNGDPAHQPANAHPTAVRALPAPGPPSRLAGPLLQPAHPVAARHEAGRVQ